MLKKVLLLVYFMSHIVNAQVGVGTTDPKSTLEVVGNPSNTTSKDGFIPPKLQRSQLIAKTGYGVDQTGAVVYVTDISGTTNTATAKVTTTGYFFWDGDSWEPIGSSGDGRNMYTDNGSLSNDRVVSQGIRTLSFNSTATSGTSHFNVDSGTLNVDANNNRIGVGNTAPSLTLDVTTTTGIGLKTSNATQWDHLMFNTGPTSSSISAGGAEDGLQFRVGSSASGSYGGQTYTTVATMMPSGNVGIGNTTPHAPLQFGNTIANRKVVLWEGFNNDHQFYGFGVNNNILRYQVNSLNDSHVFYAAANSSTASNELLRIQGNGNVGIGTNNPQQRLDVNGNIRLNNNNSIYYQNTPDYRLVIREDFETAASGWSNNTRSTYLGQNILGGYNVTSTAPNQKTYNLTGIPHTTVKIKFSFYGIDSWDGEVGYVRVVGTGAGWSKSISQSEITRENITGNSAYNDGIYYGEIEVPHSESNLRIIVGSTLDQAPDDESYGIDNIEIWVR